MPELNMSGPGVIVLPTIKFNYEVYNRLDKSWSKWNIEKAQLPGESYDQTQQRARMSLLSFVREKAQMSSSRITAEAMKENPELRHGVYDLQNIKLVNV